MQYTIQPYIHYKYTTIYYYAVHGTDAPDSVTEGNKPDLFGAQSATCYNQTICSNSCFLRRIKGKYSNRPSVLCYYSACFRNEWWERVLTWHGESLSPVMPFRKDRITLYTMSPFSSGLAGSLHSPLHENYSMRELRELKECGFTQEQLAERHIHSLATQRVQEAQEKWKDSRD